MFKVSGVRPFRVVEAVTGIRRVEVSARGLEVRCYGARLVEVDAVLARLDSLLAWLEVDGDGDAVRALDEFGGAHRVAFRVLKLRCSCCSALRTGDSSESRR